MSVKIGYNGKEYSVSGDETILDALLSAGQDIPFSCKNGICQTCVMKTREGTVPEASQKGIRDTLKHQGYFLACLCKPETDIAVALPDVADIYGRATVLEREMVADDVCRVILDPATPLYYRAGQFMNIRREDGLVRSYSLASVPSHDDHLELHIKRLPRGMMSNWFCDTLASGDHVDIQGPNGNCFYLPGQPDQDMRLVGNGTGLAPLIGIARDALYSGHSGQINLYHGTRNPGGLYATDTLRALEAEYANFHYFPCVSGDSVPDGCRPERAEVAALADTKHAKSERIFLCGYPPMVASARKSFFLAGAELSQIYSDPFELRDLREHPRE